MAEIKSKAIMITVISIIVAILLIFNITSESANSLKNASSSITDANNCSISLGNNSEQLVYNESTKFCDNESGTPYYTAGETDLPLASLFASTGILMLILMAAILIFSVKIILSKKQ